MNITLGLIHGLDFLLGYWLVGSIVFNFFILPGGGSTAAQIDRNRFQKLLLPTLITSTLWMLASAYNMTESWSPNDLWMAMSSTTFGHLWCLRIAILTLALTASYKLKNINKARYAFILLTFILPLISILTSHQASQADHTALRIFLGLLHAVAVGIWTGGLWTLIAWLSRRLSFGETDPLISYRLVKRFSIFAMCSTAIIGISGFILATLAGVSLSAPLSTTYGKFVIGKIILFCVVLGIASINQFIHLKRWKITAEKIFITDIHRESRRELVIIVIIFILAGFLTMTSV